MMKPSEIKQTGNVGPRVGPLLAYFDAVMGTPIKLVWQVSVILAMVLPWLVYPQGAPSPSIPPWLFSLTCTAILLSLLQIHGLLHVWVAIGLVAIALAWGVNHDGLAFALSVIAVGSGAARIARRPKRNEFAKLVAGAWLFAALINSLIGLIQYFGVGYHFAPWVSVSGAGEVFGNLRQRNQFATLTNIGLAALIWWVSFPRRIGWIAPQSWGWLFVAVLLAVGNAASSSRTGLVQLGLITIISLWWGWRQPAVWRVLSIVLAAYAAAALVLPVLTGHGIASSGILFRLHDAGPACGSRLALWNNVLHLISQRPWLGWGWGELDYAHFITLYPGERFCEILDNAHNLPLHLAVELGVPASLVVCGTGLWLIWRAKPWQEQDATRQLAWAVLAVILLHSMVEYPLWYGPFQMAFGLCLWLLWPGQGRKQPEIVNGPILPLGRGLIVASLLALAAYAAWDYHRISQIYLKPEQRSAAYRNNTLEKIRGSWLFRNQVVFAELSITSLTRDNAGEINTLAHDMLHYSPEASVVEKLIESAVMLGREDEARFFLARYRAAYPKEHARWAKANAQ